MQNHKQARSGERPTRPGRDGKGGEEAGERGPRAQVRTAYPTDPTPSTFGVGLQLLLGVSTFLAVLQLVCRESTFGARLQPCVACPLRAYACNFCVACPHLAQACNFGVTCPHLAQACNFCVACPLLMAQYLRRGSWAQRLSPGKTIQGYLAHKKAPPSLGPPWKPRHGPSVGSYGVVVSYERGTPESARKAYPIPSCLPS